MAVGAAPVQGCLNSKRSAMATFAGHLGMCVLQRKLRLHGMVELPAAPVDRVVAETAVAAEMIVVYVILPMAINALG